MSASKPLRSGTSARPSSRPCFTSARRSNEKMVLAISDVRPTSRDEIVEVVLTDGRAVRLRRDMAEFYPGRVVVPLWLGQRILAGNDNQREG